MRNTNTTFTDECSAAAKLNIPEKKLDRFLRVRIRNSKELLNYYNRKLKLAISNKELSIKPKDLYFNVNEIQYKVIGLFTDTTLLINKVDTDLYYETKTVLVEEAFGYRKTDEDGKIIIPKLSQIELDSSSLKTLKKLEDKDFTAYKDWKTASYTGWTDYYQHSHNSTEIAPKIIESLKELIKDTTFASDKDIIVKATEFLTENSEIFKSITFTDKSNVKMLELRLITKISERIIRVKKE